METNQFVVERKVVTQEMREQLRKPLPEEAISQHPTKKFLSTIKAIYVIERLNDVFGVGSWNTHSDFLEKVDKMVVVKTQLYIPEYSIQLEAFGGNDNADLGDAYKGAVTDSITKIGSYLEIGIDVFKGKHKAPVTSTTNFLTSNKTYQKTRPTLDEMIDEGEQYMKTLTQKR